MTPKQQYEARKAARQAEHAKANYQQTLNEQREEELHDMLDRFVTAVESIAVSLEARR